MAPTREERFYSNRERVRQAAEKARLLEDQVTSKIISRIARQLDLDRRTVTSHLKAIADQLPDD